MDQTTAYREPDASQVTITHVTYALHGLGLALGAFGAGALAMTLIGFGWSRLKAVFFADHVLLNGFFLFLGKWAYEVMMNLVERRTHGAELLMQILVWSSLSAAVTAVAGVLALMLLRPVLETRGS